MEIPGLLFGQHEYKPGESANGPVAILKMSACIKVLRTGCFALLVCFFAACASSSLQAPEGRVGDICGPGRMLICTEPVNEVTRCVCSSRKSLEEILEPDRT